MELKGRLKLIAEKVPKCNVVSDIGTDHAYIPIYLVSKGICRCAIASDIKPGPVNAAKKNIEMAGLNEKIKTRMGPGISTIEKDEADVFILAGMGGILIKEILEESLEVSKTANLIILQAMNALDILRKWLNENGFAIMDEELVKEGEKIYVVMSIKWTGIKYNIEEVNYHIGVKLVEKRDPLLEAYLKKRIRQIDKVLFEIESSNCKEPGVYEEYKALKYGMEEIQRCIREVN
jgi:tRNA (adenine22-N1)-methyltransferase